MTVSGLTTMRVLRQFGQRRTRATHKSRSHTRSRTRLRLLRWRTVRSGVGVPGSQTGARHVFVASRSTRRAAISTRHTWLMTVSAPSRKYNIFNCYGVFSRHRTGETTTSLQTGNQFIVILDSARNETDGPVSRVNPHGPQLVRGTQAARTYAIGEIEDDKPPIVLLRTISALLAHLERESLPFVRPIRPNPTLPIPTSPDSTVGRSISLASAMLPR